MPCEFIVKIAGKKAHLHWEFIRENLLHCYVTYEPLSEDANKQLITEIAESLGINKSKVRLIHGVEDHQKTFKITDQDINFDDVLNALGLMQKD